MLMGSLRDSGLGMVTIDQVIARPIGRPLRIPRFSSSSWNCNPR